MKVVCPKCGSDQLSSNQKGFSAGKAIGGAMLVGGIGLLAGTSGSKKVTCTCLACGNQFAAGKGKVILEPGETMPESITKENNRLQRNKRINKITLIVFASFIILLILIVELTK